MIRIVNRADGSLFRNSLILSFLSWCGLLLSGLVTDVYASRDYSLKAPLAERSLLLAGCAIDDMIVAVGERGHILISHDNGSSWHQADVPTQATLTGVFFHDKERGWAVGHDAIILRTRNGGETWERVYYRPQEETPLLDVLFVDAQKGFAVGAYGLFLATDDGGDAWESRSIGNDDFHLNAVVRSGNGSLFIAAESGMIYRSDDGGETWVELESPYRGSFFGALPLAGDSVLILGLRGHLLRSDDKGENWEPVETGTEAMLTGGVFSDEGTIVVGGLEGTLLISSDGGRSFTHEPQPDRKGIGSVVQAKDGAIIVIGECGVKRIEIQALLPD
ncbi:MAG: hypothetical protein JXD19_10165 [Deltaproteobacteria bacterium]|nr:hypothetical protein [Deltaproteobacteria bacterium]